MANPVVAEVLRGGQVESRHEGAIAVVDGGGALAFALGDIERPIFPRSAVKSMQALPMVEAGAADEYGFGNRELALACASHNGEAAHADLSADMLARAGFDLQALECGAHWPSDQTATVALARTGASPTALHNNCSGKHSGFLCGCRKLGLDHRGYVKIGHDYQRLIAQTMTDVTGAAHTAENSGIDGCSIPTYAVPLKNLAHGFARMATGTGLGQARAAAARRLFDACMAEPFYVAGTGRADTAIMEAGKGRVFVKVGAEGVFCGAVPELGLGFALKVDDGAVRAAEAAVAGLLSRLLKGDELSETYRHMATVTLRNWNGIEVGAVRAV
ncbi:MAG: asparaginase [Mesorhizobium sp.]